MSMSEFLYNSLVSYVYQPAGMQDADATVQLSDVALFPTVCNYRITIDNEIMLVTANTGGLLSVTRGMEGTVASAHANNAAVFVVMTAEGLSTALSGSGSGISPVCIWAQNFTSPVLVAGVPTLLTMDGEILAVGGAVLSSVVAANSGVTLGTAGVYKCTVFGQLNVGVAGDAQFGIAVNGSNVFGGSLWTDAAGGYVWGEGLFSLLGTDEVEFYITSAVGGGTVINAFLEVVRVG